MKSRSAIGAIALAALTLLPASAYGEPTPSPSPEVTKSPVEQYRIDRANYLEAVRERETQPSRISMPFLRRAVRRQFGITE